MKDLLTPLTEEEVAALVAIRRDLHRHPELGFEEERTAGVVRRELEALGLAAEPICGTGVLAVVPGAVAGPTILLRADLDALPIQEENTHDHRSVRPGRMHACGHDGHAAILLGVARRLLRCRDELRGRVLLLFQPAEEGRGGAEAVLRSGLLERHAPLCCAGLHLWTEAPTGRVIVTEGPFMASVDRFRITLQGRGGHGALPHEARDPVVAAAQVVLGLQTIVSRETDPAESAVLTVGRIRGGEAFNVIPDHVEIEGTVRTFSAAVRDGVEASLRRIAAGVAEAAGTKAEVAYRRLSAPLVNDPTWCAVVREVAERVPDAELGPGGVRTMAGEDFAFVLERCPGVYFFLGAGNPEVGAVFSHHHPRFEFDEAALPIGVQMLTGFALAASRREDR